MAFIPEPPLDPASMTMSDLPNPPMAQPPRNPVTPKTSTAGMAKMIPTESTTTTTSDLTPEQRAAIAEDKAKAAEAGGHVQDESELEARLEAEKTNRHAQIAQDEAKDFAARKQMLSQHNPTNFWADKTQGQKALGLLGMALGPLGAALSGHPDETAGMYRDAVERHAQEQKDAYQKLLDMGKLSQEQYENLDKNVDHMASAALLHGAKEAVTRSGQTGDPIIIAKGKMAADKLEDEARKRDLELLLKGIENKTSKTDIGPVNKQAQLIATAKKAMLDPNADPSEKKAAANLLKKFKVY